MISQEVLKTAFTNKSKSLNDLSIERPVLLVFLRQFGCIYCKEALNDLSKIADDIATLNVSLVLVHLSSLDDAKIYLENFNLQEVDQISDPDCKLYSEFGLVKGTIGQLFGLKVWSRGFVQMTKGSMYSLRPVGDGFQMPGVFIIHKSEVKNMFVHNSIADRPDYLSLLKDVIEKLN